MYAKVLRTECGFDKNCPEITIKPEDGGDLRITGYRPGTEHTPENEVDVVVPRTLLPEVTALDVPDLDEFLARVEKPSGDKLRVQTLAQYGVPSDQDYYQRYLDGRPGPTAEDLAPWGAELDADHEAGRTWRNLHVINGELGDYLRYQFEWAYTFNVTHGMDIRIADAAEQPAVAAVLELGDYWVIEHQHVVLCRYSDGVPQGLVRVESSGAHGYVAAAEMAWHLSVPFAQWWAEHPQYHRASPHAA
jgi:hypothetical protein